jgi:hypothetical protein
MKTHPSITPARVEEAVERQQRSRDKPGFCIICGAEAWASNLTTKNASATYAARLVSTAPASCWVECRWGEQPLNALTVRLDVRIGEV